MSRGSQSTARDHDLFVDDKEAGPADKESAVRREPLPLRRGKGLFEGRTIVEPKLRDPVECNARRRRACRLLALDVALDVASHAGQLINEGSVHIYPMTQELLIRQLGPADQQSSDLNRSSPPIFRAMMASHRGTGDPAAKRPADAGVFQASRRGSLEQCPIILNRARFPFFSLSPRPRGERAG